MDEVKAKEWDDRFRGTKIEDWTIESVIDHGKSAAVFRASGPDGKAAVKIFDDDLIKRFGDHIQLGRIKRELSLIGQTHSNMVRLLGGGLHEDKHHYIVMEYLDGPSLSKCLKDIPEANIPSLMEQLVSACEFLETLDLAHRDIKPANIVILDDFKRLVLLDFGVLKPIGDPALTDVDGQHLFIGTLQYSSPEFLLRDEVNDAEGFHAISLYQVGAVLHDLIMRRPLFEDFVNPYAAMVNAVQHETPGIASETVPSYLLDACRMALVKDPKKRAELVDWNSFRTPPPMSIGEQARKHVSQQLLLAEAIKPSTQAQSKVDAAVLELRETVVEALKSEFRRIRQANSTTMPPIVVTRPKPRAPELVVQFNPNESFKLVKGLRFEVEVEVIDLDSQAIGIRMAAADGTAPLEKSPKTEIFKGPFSSGTFGDRMEAAIFVCLAQAIDGKEGTMDLGGLGEA
ncbi:MAG: protein kinase [Mesorhizobium sp.]